MRSAAGFALSFLVLSSVHGQTFPAAITPERAVSAIVRTGVGRYRSFAGPQSNPHVATNGDIALVTWVDSRDGSFAVYCARVDAAGNVLDPLGVRLLTGYWLYSVAWNGESFVVIVGTTFTLISPDLTTITTKQLALRPNSSLVATTTGADPRFLFFEGAGTAAVVDARGNVVIEEQLDAAKGAFTIAGGNETSFLLLQNGLAHHLDRDGNVLSIVDANIGTLGIRQFGTLAGGPDGFLMAGFQGPENQPEVAVHWFNFAGVHTNSRVLSKVGPSQSAAGLALVREANRYVVVWLTNEYGTSNVSEFVAAVGVDNTVTASVAASTDILRGHASGISIASGRGARFVATNLDDVFIQSLTETLQPPAPSLVTASGTLQTVSGVAAGANGYAVAWIEYGPDSIHKYVRRFSETGVPQDDAPIPIVNEPNFNIPTSQTTIVSNGETYLVGWYADGAFFIRRLDAAGGQWIDPEPISLGITGPVTLASNGRDALAFGSVRSCNPQCLATQRISLTGAPLTSPPVTILAPGYLVPTWDVVGSNGTDYLAVWFQSPGCVIDPCAINPGKIYAARLHADGTAIDAQPMQLSANDRAVANLTIAWADGRYLVAWSDINAGVRGTRITAEGTVLDRDPDFGGVLLAGGQYNLLRAVASGVGRQFVLLLNRISRSGDLNLSTLEGVAFDARADLASVSGLTRTVIAPAETNSGRNAVAVGRGYTFAAAYDRLNGEAGNVPRVFLRLFAEPVPRRRAAR